MKRREYLTLMASGSVLALAPAARAFAADFPSKPIQLVVWGSPGSGTDVFGRSLAPLVGDALGVSVVVDNRPGGGGAVAMRYIEAQPADGYTVLVATSSMLPIVVRDHVKMPKIIAIAGETTLFLATKADSQFASLQEAIDFAKANPKKLKIGKSLSGGAADQLVHDLARLAGIEVTSIPYEGTAEVQQAILSGEVDIGVGSSPTIALVTSGTMRGLAVASDNRLPAMPDVPTLRELDIDTPARLWRGIVVNADTPDDVVHTLYEAFHKAFSSKEFLAGMEKRNEVRTEIPEDRVQGWVEAQVEPTREFLDALGLL